MEYELTEYAFDFFNDLDLVPTVVKTSILIQYASDIQSFMMDPMRRIPGTGADGEVHYVVTHHDAFGGFVAHFWLRLYPANDPAEPPIYRCFFADIEGV